MFSRRLDWSAPTNALSVLVDEKRARGVSIRDLTLSNPTTAGIDYPTAEICAALADPRLAVYEPAPRGLASARAAIAARVDLDPAAILLTASTSEAYSLLFKLFCDPGDAVLAPEPSYPLFAHLAALDGVNLATYPLAYDGEWHIDFPALEATLAATPRARAILVVSPNNPTGSYLKHDELARLESLGLPLVCDEVFADYPADDLPAPTRVTCAARAAARTLTFSLGGLSKSAGLPQLKLGWIAAGGPKADTADALAKLELICDSYLSLSTPVQLAAPRLLELGDGVRAQILARVRQNRARITATLAPHPHLALLPAEAGWTAVIRVPSTRTDEEIALELLREHDTLVHPGYFFDFRGGTFLIVSLLCAPADLDAGLAALLSVTVV